MIPTHIAPRPVCIRIPAIACRAAIVVTFLLRLLAATPASAQDPAGEEIRLGYLLSRAGGFNSFDRAGAAFGEDEINRQGAALGRRFRVIFAEGGRSNEVVDQAKFLVEKQGARVLLGSVSDAATVAVAEYAQERGVVFFNVGSGVDSLRGESCRPNTFSIGPSLTMRVRALGQWTLQAKEWKTWAIAEGDSRTEQRIAETARAYLLANGGTIAGTVRLNETEAHDPAQALQALRGIKADFLFVALTGEKQGLFLDAFQKAGIALPVGGAAPELERMGRFTQRFAGYWAAGWSHQNDIFGASELNNRFADFAGFPMNERAWAAWAGLKILGEAILRAESPAAEKLVPYLREKLIFDGYMGPAMGFRPWNRQLRLTLYVLRVNHEPAWNGWDVLVREASLPVRGLKGWKGDPLDSIDFTEQESGCKY